MTPKILELATNGIGACVATVMKKFGTKQKSVYSAFRLIYAFFSIFVLFENDSHSPLKMIFILILTGIMITILILA
jgi:hypothetical protein